MWGGVCGCDCVGESGCVWLVLYVVMWAEMEIFMHVSHVYMLSLQQSFTCVSQFSSVNSECSDEVSHYSDDSDVDSSDDSVEEDDNSDEESDLEGVAPTTKRCKVA